MCVGCSFKNARAAIVYEACVIALRMIDAAIKRGKYGNSLATLSEIRPLLQFGAAHIRVDAMKAPAAGEVHEFKDAA